MANEKRLMSRDNSAIRGFMDHGEDVRFPRHYDPCPTCSYKIQNPLFEQHIEELEKMLDDEIDRRLKADAVIETLVDRYIRNRGSSHEFVSCITPKGIPEYWTDAMDYLEDHNE